MGFEWRYCRSRSATVYHMLRTIACDDSSEWGSYP